MADREVRVVYDALWGGVSQQPAHLRFPNQCEACFNATLDVRHGARKRPGSRFLTAVTGLSADTDYRLHPIERDDTENYLVVYGNNVLKVFEAGTGLEANVTIDSAADNYLKVGATKVDIVGSTFFTDGIRLNASFTTSTKTLVSPQSDFANYTYASGDRIYIFGGTGVTEGWYTIASRVSDTTITLVEDIGGTNPTDVSFGDVVAQGGLDDLRVVTVADTTFIVNTTVKVGKNNNSLANATMPVTLTRTSFTGDGTTPAEFDVDTVNYTNRNSLPGGFTNADNTPSFVNDFITDVAFFQNRLVFSSGEDITFSRAGDIFNFFVDDLSSPVDDDPINVQIGSEAVTTIDWMVPYRDSIAIFTKANRQFELDSNGPFTANSVRITPTTSYYSQAVRPRLMGDLLYFLSSRNNVAQVLEYAYDDVRNTSRATDITAHVYNYLPESMRDLEVSANDETIFVLTDQCNTIYVNKSFWNGNEKQQNAWNQWTFDSDLTVIDVAAIRGNLYCLMESTAHTSHAIDVIPIALQPI